MQLLQVSLLILQWFYRFPCLACIFDVFIVGLGIGRVILFLTHWGHCFHYSRSKERCHEGSSSEEGINFKGWVKQCAKGIL